MRAAPVFLAFALVACAAKKSGPKSYDESTDGLHEMFSDLSRAVQKGDEKTATSLAEALVLPDHAAWFKATFGEEAGARVDAEYAKNVPGASRTIPSSLAGFLKQGRTEFWAEKFTDAGDPKSNTYQDVALKGMKQRVALYSMRFVEPGKKKGAHLYNFVYVGGAFRFVGKLLEVNPSPNIDSTAEVRAIAEYRLKEREEFFKSGKTPSDE